MLTTMYDLLHMPKVTWVISDDIATAIPHDPDQDPVVFVKVRTEPTGVLEQSHAFWQHSTGHPTYHRDAQWLFEMTSGIYTFYHTCDDPDPDRCEGEDYKIDEVFK